MPTSIAPCFFCSTTSYVTHAVKEMMFGTRANFGTTQELEFATRLNERSICPPMHDTVCAIVVTYYPDAKLPLRIAAIASQVKSVLIVDNSPDEKGEVVLRQISVPKVAFILNRENLGIATALNQGVRWAAQHGFHWALTFDQDTIVSPRLLEVQRRIYEQLKTNRVAVIGSNYEDPESGRPLLPSSRFKNAEWVQMSVAITSGSLIPVSVFERLGPFRDEFFIDHVDTEFCLRALKNGYKVVITREPLMLHRLGNAASRRVFGIRFTAAQHSGLRWYYRTRNHVVLTREYLFINPRCVLASIVYTSKLIMAMLLVERQRWATLRWMVAGLADGLRMRLGRRDLN